MKSAKKQMFHDVCHCANIRILKQITTVMVCVGSDIRMSVTVQIYEF